ncbi:MAG: hypothetical protein ACR2PT_09415 [Endozoicomonas sp.]
MSYYVTGYKYRPDKLHFHDSQASDKQPSLLPNHDDFHRREKDDYWCTTEYRQRKPEYSHQLSSPAAAYICLRITTCANSH